MASFKNRALTIATAGLLASSPLSVAADGLLQPEQVVVQPVEKRPIAGGGIRHIDYQVPSVWRFVSNIYLNYDGHAQSKLITQKTSYYRYRFVFDWFASGSASHRIESRYSYQNSVGFAVKSDTQSRFVAADTRDAVITINIASDSADGGYQTIIHGETISPSIFVNGRSRVQFIPAFNLPEQTNDYAHSALIGFDVVGNGVTRFSASMLNRYIIIAIIPFGVEGDASIGFVSNEKTVVRHVSMVGIGLVGETSSVRIESYDDEEDVVIAFVRFLQGLG